MSRDCAMSGRARLQQRGAGITTERPVVFITQARQDDILAPYVLDQCIRDGMSFPANVLMVMIASPGDVQDERRIVTEELYRWNNANAVSRRLVLQPVKWETHSTPESGAPAQDLIDANLLHNADIIVGIFGNRIGTPTDRHPSGTVGEIKDQITARKQAMIYFSRVPVDIKTVDFEQRKAVEAFQEECKSFSMYSEYTSYEDFRPDFKHHLDITLNKPEYVS